MTNHKTKVELQELAKRVKAVFFDIDDTLRLKDEEYMPESVPQVFKKLKEKGILTGIASGRSYVGIVEEVRDLGADYYVTINGQYVRKPDGEEVYSNPIPQNVVEDTVQWAKDAGIELAFIGSDKVAITKWDEYAEACLPVVYGKVQEDPEFYKHHRVYQMLTLSKDANKVVLPDVITNQVRLVKWHPYSNDIVPMEGSKANGISKVLDRIGLTAEDILVFGDEMNDVEMFQYAGLAVAMGNANWQVKPLADFVTKPVEENGIQYALETLKIIEE